MIRHSWQLILVACAVVGSGLAARPVAAEIKTHGLFTDNMLLQRERKVSIWGTTDKPDAVTVKFGDQSVSATPADGKWKAELAAMPDSWPKGTTPPRRSGMQETPTDRSTPHSRHRQISAIWARVTPELPDRTR